MKTANIKIKLEHELLSNKIKTHIDLEIPDLSAAERAALLTTLEALKNQLEINWGGN